MYPQIIINLNKLAYNTNTLVSKCRNNGINSIFGVIKVLAGDLKSINTVVNSGISHIADSRIENLKLVENYPLPKVLLRLPMLSIVSDVVKYADISLNSELKIIKKLNEEAKLQNKIHKIILMFDLGDLREGIWYDSNYLIIVKEILELKNISLIGIGTNLTCYGGVIPTKDNLNDLLSIKKSIEKEFNINLDIISGGNTSSLHLIFNDLLPKGINNLRLGEGIFLGRETAFENNIDDLYQDVFELNAEIIEYKEKPSLPRGEIGVDAFGNKPEFIDKGIIKRAIVAIGKQDVYHSNIEPIDKDIEIIGSSSDHLLIDVTKCNYKLGDIVKFKMSYGGLLQLMTSNYVKKVHITDIV